MRRSERHERLLRRRAEAAALREQGYSLTRIARALGVSDVSVRNYLRVTPHERPAVVVSITGVEYERAPAEGRRRRGRETASALRQELRDETACALCGGGPIEWHDPAERHRETPRLRVGNLESAEAIRAEIARCVPLCRRCHMAEDGRLEAWLTQNRARTRGS